jgi:hypothetical protein
MPRCRAANWVLWEQACNYASRCENIGSGSNIPQVMTILFARLAYSQASLLPQVFDLPLGFCVN